MARRSNGEGTAAQQRKNGTWYRAVRIEGTNQRKFLYGKTKAEVDKKYKEFIKQVAGGTYTEVKKQSVEAYLFDWLTTYKKIELKPKSYDRLECQHHIGGFLNTELFYKSHVTFFKSDRLALYHHFSSSSI